MQKLNMNFHFEQSVRFRKKILITKIIPQYQVSAQF